jgi:Tfp pilus assembly protein PilF
MLSARRSIAILLVGLALGGLLVLEIATPIRERIADRYVERGDSYLVSQDFDVATEQYDKALSYDKNNQDAKNGQKLAALGPVDIAKLKDFYEQNRVDSVLSKLALASQNFTDAKQALQVGVNFYADHDYAYARYPMEKAVSIDPGYPEAWHYLGQTYQKLAQWDSSYTAKATDAFKHRDELTPNYRLPSPSPTPSPSPAS